MGHRAFARRRELPSPREQMPASHAARRTRLLAADVVVCASAQVLLAEFAQQKHMLRFEEKGGVPKYISTRCKDGDILSGVALRAEKGGHQLAPGWWGATA